MTEVSISSGRIRGAAVSGHKTPVRRFLGIPYAEPPVGPLRWRPTEPVSPWQGVRDALAFGPMAPQLLPLPNSLYASGDLPQSEDCLTLNVWTGPEGDTDRPVLVWLHFGAFQFGSSSNPLYNGEALAASGATVVTVNYRLNRLGFLAHPALSAESETGTSGNFGLLDQIEALRWVQENIASFGGDPDCVTLIGCSAGAHSVYCLQASPLAKGLFHRAVAHSGVGFAPPMDGPSDAGAMLTLAGAERAGVEFSELLGVDDTDGLRALSVEQVLTTSLERAAGPWHMDLLPPEITSSPAVFDSGYPIIDGHVLPRSLGEVFADGQQNDVPTLSGSTANESSGLPFLTSLEAYRAMLRDTFGSHATEVLRLYPVASDEEVRRVSGKLCADRMFTWETWTAARMHAQTGKTPVYLFRFVHEPPLPDENDIAERNNARAFHSAEIPYLFGSFAARDWPWSDADRELGAVISGSWLQFARTGDPNGAGLPHWPPFRGGNGPVLALGTAPAIIDIPDEERLAFWDKFYADSQPAIASVAART